MLHPQEPREKFTILTMHCTAPGPPHQPPLPHPRYTKLRVTSSSSPVAAHQIQHPPDLPHSSARMPAPTSTSTTWISARVSPLFFLATIQALWSVVQCLTISQGSLKWWAYTVKSHCFWTLKVCLCMHNAPLNCFAEAFAREKRKKLQEILTQLHLFV